MFEQDRRMDSINSTGMSMPQACHASTPPNSQRSTVVFVLVPNFGTRGGQRDGRLLEAARAGRLAHVVEIEVLLEDAEGLGVELPVVTVPEAFQRPLWVVALHADLFPARAGVQELVGVAAHLEHLAEEAHGQGPLVRDPDEGEAHPETSLGLRKLRGRGHAAGAAAGEAVAHEHARGAPRSVLRELSDCRRLLGWPTAPRAVVSHDGVQNVRSVQRRDYGQTHEIRGQVLVGGHESLLWLPQHDHEVSLALFPSRPLLDPAVAEIALQHAGALAVHVVRPLEVIQEGAPKCLPADHQVIRVARAHPRQVHNRVQEGAATLRHVHPADGEGQGYLTGHAICVLTSPCYGSLDL
mmetsp:Transcript_14479/g.41469  ORF Transcript_14479/g.41469 Transcript_14479/m.41469 type:complete len:353 (+) Transcript_14479:179-1237(+)